MPQNAHSFIHLSVHSHYSLLGGMPSPKNLATAAAKQKFPALAITDSNNVFGAVDVSKALPKAGVQPILGAQVQVLTGNETKTITLLVQNKAGWRNLLQIITNSNIESACEYAKAVAIETICTHNAGLILLTGGARFGLPACSETFTTLQTAFGNRMYVELQRHGLEVEQKLEPELLSLALKLNLPIVATNDCRFLKESQTEAYNALVCIGESLTVDDPTHTSFNKEYAFKPATQMCELFADIPEATANTTAIAKRCGYWLHEVNVKKMFMPPWHTEAGETTEDLLQAKSNVGLEKRLAQQVFTKNMSTEKQAEIRTEYTKRLETELSVIIQMGFEGYFLITSDFIRWAKDNGIPVGPGRGSGAGSLVAWCLDITDLDPIKWKLYFERFLNPERISLPDFDIDFCQERRDEVIHYVQEKYGKDRVSQIITFGTLKARACIRDVGRVLQLPYNLVGRIASFVPEGPTPPSIKEVLEADERLQQLADEEEGVTELLEIAMQLEGCLRHASTHAAGVIIADRPIVDVCGLYADPRSDMPATQFPMYDAEFSGLVKFDFLGLKTLTTIRKTVDMIKANKSVEIDIDNIPLDDEKTYKMLQAGETIGVFQIESAGMTDLTKKLQPNCMDHIAAIICLFRPGPMELLPDYVACHLKEKQPEYQHPLLEKELGDTHGIAIYQEQVLRMAQVLAGYTLGGADILRRAMGKKKPAEMAKQREKFVSGCAQHNNIEEKLANEIFDKMAAFAGYGFNKAHTMAYTLVAYQTAYLKAHYPLEFMAATMTMDKGNTDKLLVHKSELQRMGAELLTPDINKSQVLFAVESNGVRHALAAIKGAGEEAMHQVVAERNKNGKYKNVWDFLNRQTPHIANKKNLEVLAKAGGFDEIYPNRAELVENVHILQAYCQQIWDDKNSNQIGLFGGEGQAAPATMPTLTPTPKWNTTEKLHNELQVIGFYLSDHPLSTFKYELKNIENLFPVSKLAELAEKGKKTATIAGVVLAKREMKTKKGDRMGFITISDETGQEEIVLFPEAYISYAEMITGQTPLVVNINMSAEGERLRLNVTSMQPLENLAKMRKQITILVEDIEALQPLQEKLMAEKGQTTCNIIVTRENQPDVKLRLPHGIECSHQLLSTLNSGAGVKVL